MLFMLAGLIVLPHQQMQPVLINKTGLGLWESVADVRHLSVRDRVKFADALHRTCIPHLDMSTHHGKEAMAEYAKTSMRRTNALVHEGRLIEDYWFFDTHREELTKQTKARGLTLLYDSDN